jgi:plasmid stabilization system protein ParE
MVVLTAQAEFDWERIGDATERESPRRAVIFVAELRKKFAPLAAIPKAFPVIGRFRRVAIRRRVHIGRRALAVLRVLHGATNYGGDPNLTP